MGSLPIDLARNLDHVTRDAVFSQVLLCCKMALAPFSCGGVGADQEESDCCGDNDDERDDKGDAPCLVWGKA